jgi:hypothetical protein
MQDFPSRQGSKQNIPSSLPPNETTGTQHAVPSSPRPYNATKRQKNVGHRDAHKGANKEPSASATETVAEKDSQLSKQDSSNRTQPDDSARSQQATLRQRRPLRNELPPLELKELYGNTITNTVTKLRRECNITPSAEIHLLLNPEEISQAVEEKFAEEAHKTEGWRNGLILVPIMLTWISLGLAGLAYTQSINKDSTLITKPLLQQWVEGFTTLNAIQIWLGWHVPIAFGSWHPFTFGDVAIADVFLFILLLWLTIRSHRKEVRASKAANTVYTWLRDECEILCENSYTNSIGPGYGGDTPEWAYRVNKSIEDLQIVLRDATTLIGSLSGVLADERGLVESALRAIDNLNGMYQGSHDTYRNLDAGVGKIARSFENMENSQSQTVRELDDIATSVKNASEAIVQVAQPFKEKDVGRIAEETRNQLRQTQQRQQYVQDALDKQTAMLSRMGPKASSPARRWWDVFKIFRKP